MNGMIARRSICSTVSYPERFTVTFIPAGDMLTPADCDELARYVGQANQGRTKYFVFHLGLVRAMSPIAVDRLVSMRDAINSLGGTAILTGLTNDTTTSLQHKLPGSLLRATFRIAENEEAATRLIDCLLVAG
jgi:hypothetical protein